MKLIVDTKLRIKLSTNSLNWASNFDWNNSSKELMLCIENCIQTESNRNLVNSNFVDVVIE